MSCAFGSFRWLDWGLRVGWMGAGFGFCAVSRLWTVLIWVFWSLTMQEVTATSRHYVDRLFDPDPQKVLQGVMWVCFTIHIASHWLEISANIHVRWAACICVLCVCVSGVRVSLAGASIFIFNFELWLRLDIGSLPDCSRRVFPLEFIHVLSEPSFREICMIFSHVSMQTWAQEIRTSAKDENLFWKKGCWYEKVGSSNNYDSTDSTDWGLNVISSNSGPDSCFKEVKSKTSV